MWIVGVRVSLPISWLALVPLLQMIGLPALARSFTWLLLIVALAASAWTALFAYRLTTASARACLLLGGLGFALAALYRLVAVRLWPASDVALQFAFVAVGLTLVMFAAHLGLLLTHGDTTMQQQLRRDGHRIALAYSEAGVLVAALTWFAVAIA